MNLRRAILAALITGILLLGVSAGVNFHRFNAKIYPDGDFAADMLLTSKISEDGYLLTGQYSRFEFNHPGPFFFYINHIAEILLAATKIDRAKIWMLVSWGLNVFFIVLSAGLASRYFNLNITVARLTVFSITVMTFFDIHLMDVWMPDRIVTPYLAFVFATLLVSLGRLIYFPIAAVLASILIHGYISMLVFTLPVLSVALIHGFIQQKNGFLRKDYGFIGLGLLMGFIFALPMMIDWLINSPNNITRILSAAKTGEDVSLNQAIVFSLKLLTYQARVLYIPLVILGLLAIKEWRTAKLRLMRFLGYFSFASIIFIAFHQAIPGPLHEFMGLYYWSYSIGGISVFALLAITSKQTIKSINVRILSKPIAITNRMMAGSILVLGACLMIKHTSLPLENPYIGELANAAQNATAKQDIVAIDYSKHGLWPQVAGLMVELDRRGRPSCTIKRKMSFLYTSHKICDEDIKPNIKLIKRQECQENCLFVSDRVAMKSVNTFLTQRMDGF